MNTTGRDPIGFELFKNTLFSIADEMALTIYRTAYSGVLKDGMDYSTAFCDGDGRTVAQGLTMPGHLGSFPDALGATLKRFGHRMKPGDIYCLNDPFEGGMHRSEERRVGKECRCRWWRDEKRDETKRGEQ